MKFTMKQIFAFIVLTAILTVGVFLFDIWVRSSQKNVEEAFLDKSIYEKSEKIEEIDYLAIAREVINKKKQEKKEEARRIFIKRKINKLLEQKKRRLNEKNNNENVSQLWNTILEEKKAEVIFQYIPDIAALYLKQEYHKYLLHFFLLNKEEDPADLRKIPV